MGKKEPAGCLFAILKMFAGPQTESVEEALPYRRKDYLLTKAERSFYGVLQQAIGTDLLLFAKVRVADIVFIERGTKARQSWFNKIQSKHVDFLLCTSDTVRPVAAVELDDASHDRKARQDRDSFLESALAAAGLPLVRFKAALSYNPREVTDALNAALHSAPGSGPSKAK